MLCISFKASKLFCMEYDQLAALSDRPFNSFDQSIRDGIATRLTRCLYGAIANERRCQQDV